MHFLLSARSLPKKLKCSLSPRRATTATAVGAAPGQKESSKEGELELCVLAGSLSLSQSLSVKKSRPGSLCFNIWEVDGVFSNDAGV